MTRYQFLLRLLAASLLGAALIPALALAQTVQGAVNASAALPGVAAAASASTTVRTKAMQNAVDRADREMDRRITQLTDLNARIQAMQKVTDAFKASLENNVQTQISALNALKVKIDGDADADTLKADVKALAPSYRIFALVMPQSRIAAAADREVTIATMMSQIGAKLQARLTAAQSAGADVSALSTVLSDLSAKLQDAGAKAQGAVSTTATLVPDAGDKTKMAANVAALKAGRTQLQAGQQDLVAARKDIQTIVDGLKKLKVSANASSTTQTTTQAQ